MSEYESNGNNDLLFAIKQVAKEMAEAVSNNQKNQKVNHQPQFDIKNLKTHFDNFSDSDGEKPRVGYSNRKNVLSSNEYYGENTKSHYEKEIDKYNNNQLKLELMRNKKIQEEKKMLMNKPKISDVSSKIIKQKLMDEKPIYLRSDEILDNKSKKLEMLTNFYREIEEMEMMEYNTRFNTGIAGKEVIENFINDQFLWKKNKEEKLELIRQEIEQIESEMDKSLYRPTINKVSEILANNRLQTENPNVHERLHNLHEENIVNRMNLKYKDLPSFSPLINRKPPTFKKQVIYTKKARDTTPPPTSNKKVIGQSKNNSKKTLNKSTIEVNEKSIINNCYQYVNDLYEDDFFNVNSKDKRQSKLDTISSDLQSGKLQKKTYHVRQKSKSDAGRNISEFSKENELYNLNNRHGSAWNKPVENSIFGKHKI